jgi:hypothetical protein
VSVFEFAGLTTKKKTSLALNWEKKMTPVNVSLWSYVFIIRYFDSSISFYTSPFADAMPMPRIHPLVALATVFTFVLVLPTLYHLSRVTARTSADVFPFKLGPGSFIPGADAVHGEPVMPHLNNSTVK